MDLRLEGKRALVTGGSSGIGLAIAESLLREGAELVLASRDQANLARAADHLRRQKPQANVSTVVMDFNNEASVRSAVKEATESGPIEILVVNTGGPAAGQVMGIELSGWDRGYTTLVRSVVLLCQLIVPSMKAKKWGRILTVTSTSAKEMIPGLPVSGTFRAGLSAFSKQFAKEIGRDGILINNLLPGPTKTGRLDELKEKNPKLIDHFVTESALGRLAEPEEIGRVAAFLLSGANTYVTGTDILADGGFTRAL